MSFTLAMIRSALGTWAVSRHAGRQLVRPVLREVRDLGRGVIVARIAEVGPGPGVKLEGRAVATLAIRGLASRDQRGNCGHGK